MRSVQLKENANDVSRVTVTGLVPVVGVRRPVGRVTAVSRERRRDGARCGRPYAPDDLAAGLVLRLCNRNDVDVYPTSVRVAVHELGSVRRPKSH